MKAIQSLKGLAKTNHYVPAIEYLADYYTAKGESGIALSYLTRGATLSSPKSYYGLGMYYMKKYEKFRTPANSAEAIRSLRRASDRGYTAATRELGLLYLTGRLGMPHNMGSAFNFLRYAAQQGDSKAMVVLAKIHLQPDRMWTNVDRVLELLKAASKTDAEASRILGTYHEAGYLVKKSLFMATEMYGRAARMGDMIALEKLRANGNREALAILGQVYAEGIVVPKDYNLAHKYYSEALTKGYSQAMLLLADLAQKEKEVDIWKYWKHEFATSQIQKSIETT
jgi:TPR repeat protein